MKKLLLLSLVVLKTYADVYELDLRHENSFESNQVNNSEINQGLLQMEDSILENSDIHTQNSVENTRLDGYSLIEQSNIELLNGSHVTDSEIDLSSHIANANIDLNSSVIQNSLVFQDASMDGSSIMSNSEIENLKAEDSTIRQSSIYLSNGSRVENESSFHLNNVVENLDIDKSILSQSEMVINDSTLNSVNISSSNILTSNRGTLKIENAVVIQGSYRIQSSSLMNSTLKSKSIMLDTTVEDSVLDTCGMSVNNATLSSVNIEKYCSMENSKISNGAVLYQGMTRVD